MMNTQFAVEQTKTKTWLCFHLLARRLATVTVVFDLERLFEVPLKQLESPLDGELVGE